jgi:hypothetical protein
MLSRASSYTCGLKNGKQSGGENEKNTRTRETRTGNKQEEKTKRKHKDEKKTEYETNRREKNEEKNDKTYPSYIGYIENKLGLLS